MDKFFNPESVAIIGASNTPFNLGASICTILKHLEFAGNIYAINRKGEEVNGCPGFTSILDIPEVVDLAVIITPSKVVPGIVRDCGEKGITHVIIESAGFSEEGETGKQLQMEVDSLTAQYGIRYIGPNCLGVMDTHTKFCCFFGFIPGMYDEAFNKPGNVSYVIQSGGIGALIMDSFRNDVVSVNKMISIGNKEGVDESDMLEYFSRD
ncbi:MAG TPA: CoA-binding protein, partial [Spirochaetota bacterium]|nr:CoA-binding protein [Spirochaetota bacterium]